MGWPFIRRTRADFRDISENVFGKYRDCTSYEDVYYADADFTAEGKPRIGAIPAPDEDDRTPFGQKRKPKLKEAMTEDQKRQQQIAEAKETSAIIEQLALNLTQKVIEAQPDRFQKYVAVHERDIAMYRFECRRWGDFLSLFIERGANPIDSELKLSTTINLMTSRAIKMIAGNQADMNGEAAFNFNIRYAPGAGGSGTGAGFYRLREGESFNVFERSYSLPYSRPLFILDLDKEYHSTAWDMGIYEIKHRVPNCARFSKDDRIRFEGTGATIFVPAGLGQGVYETILTEIERGSSH